MTDMHIIRQDYGLTQAQHETRAADTVRHSLGTVSYRQGHRASWWEAVRWLLDAQQEWHTLPTRDAILELQKNTGSIYHPIFDDGTPGTITIWADCPTCGRTTTDSEGLCHTCGYDHLA